MSHDANIMPMNNYLGYFILLLIVINVSVVYIIMPPPQNYKIRNQNLSTCSSEAEMRGPHQKVVSFSYFWEDSPQRFLFEGIVANAELVQELYPGWLMRVYHDEESSAMLAPIKTRFRHVDLCHVDRIPAMGNMARQFHKSWRFYPMADPQVDLMMSRDLDGRVSVREAAAVAEWLQSNLTAHVMRDHPKQWCCMLPGLWGAKVAQRRTLMRHSLESMIWHGNNFGTPSQDSEFLHYLFWPYIHGDVMQHDSFHCMDPAYVPHGNIRHWPAQREDNSPMNYVGMKIDENRLVTKCPEECRPNNHKNWLMC